MQTPLLKVLNWLLVPLRLLVGLAGSLAIAAIYQFRRKTSGFSPRM